MGEEAARAGLFSVSGAEAHGETLSNSEEPTAITLCPSPDTAPSVFHQLFEPADEGRVVLGLSVVKQGMGIGTGAEAKMVSIRFQRNARASVLLVRHECVAPYGSCISLRLPRLTICYRHGTSWSLRRTPLETSIFSDPADQPLANRAADAANASRTLYPSVPMCMLSSRIRK